MRAGEALESVDELRKRIDECRPFTTELVARIQDWLVPWFIYCSGALGQRDALTYEQVQAYLEREIVSGGHPLDRFLAVDRHRAALEYVEQHAEAGGELDLPFIREVHHKLLDGARGEGHRPGLWKTRQNPATRRRGQRFRYADPADVPDLMRRLVDGFTRRQREAHALEAVAWFHYHLHLIHPFDEENGRVGRLVVSAALLHHGYPPLVIPPDELGAYLDALAACDRTAPRDAHGPLSEQLDTGPLLELHAACLTRTAEQTLDIVEGRELQARDMPEAAIQEQADTLGHLLRSDEVSWRVKGGFQVRALHRRLETLAHRVTCRGPLYGISLEESQVLPSHQVSATAIGAKLPYGDAGVVGKVVVTLTGDARAAGLEFSGPMRLQVVVASARLGMMVLLQWREDEEPEVHPGPARSDQWPEATLDRLLTRSVDRQRRRFEADLAERNLSREAQARIRETRRQRRATFRHAPADRDGEGAPAPSSSVHEAGEDPRRPGEERTGQRPSVLQGLQPSEPPLSF